VCICVCVCVSVADTIKRVLRDYHERISTLEDEKFDLEYAVKKKDFEVEFVSFKPSVFFFFFLRMTSCVAAQMFFFFPMARAEGEVPSSCFWLLALHLIWDHGLLIYNKKTLVQIFLNSCLVIVKCILLFVIFTMQISPFTFNSVLNYKYTLLGLKTLWPYKRLFFEWECHNPRVFEITCTELYFALSPAAVLS
jgi:hypothetical protein